MQTAALGAEVSAGGPHLNLDSARRRQRASAAPPTSATPTASFQTDNLTQRPARPRLEDARRGRLDLRRRTRRSADRSSATSSGSSASHRNVGNNNIVANSFYPGRVARHLRPARPQLHAAADMADQPANNKITAYDDYQYEVTSAICSPRAPTCCWRPRAGRRC